MVAHHSQTATERREIIRATCTKPARQASSHHDRLALEAKHGAGATDLISCTQHRNRHLSGGRKAELLACAAFRGHFAFVRRKVRSPRALVKP